MPIDRRSSTRRSMRRAKFPVTRRERNRSATIQLEKPVPKDEVQTEELSKEKWRKSASQLPSDSYDEGVCMQ